MKTLKIFSGDRCQDLYIIIVYVFAAFKVFFQEMCKNERKKYYAR